MSIDNIRVKVNKKYHPVYRALTQDTAIRARVFPQHSDLFTFCTVLGFREGRSNPVRSDQLFWSHVLNPYQTTTITAIAASSRGDYNLLTQPEVIIQIAEGYADAGMELLLSGSLTDYRREEPDGNYTLDFRDVDQLEKVVLSYVQGENNKDPFS